MGRGPRGDQALSMVQPRQALRTIAGNGQQMTPEERAEVLTNAGDAVISGSIGLSAGVAAGTATAPTGAGLAAGYYKATVGGAQLWTGVGLGYYAARNQKPPQWLNTSYEVTSTLDFTNKLTRPIAKKAGHAATKSLLKNESLDTAVRAGEREARQGTQDVAEYQLKDLLGKSKGWRSGYRDGKKQEVVEDMIKTGISIAQKTDWERNRRVLNEVLEAKKSKRLSRLLGEYAGKAVLSGAKTAA